MSFTQSRFGFYQKQCLGSALFDWILIRVLKPSDPDPDPLTYLKDLVEI